MAQLIWKFTGDSRTIDNKTEYLIAPTILQRSLAHYRMHPTDSVGRQALSLYSDEEISELTSQLPETWWVSQRFFDAHQEE